MAASIEEKTINVFEDHFHDGGSVNVDGARIKCWKKGGHGLQTYLEVLQNSSNPKELMQNLVNQNPQIIITQII